MPKPLTSGVSERETVSRGIRAVRASTVRGRGGALCGLRPYDCCVASPPMRTDSKARSNEEPSTGCTPGERTKGSGRRGDEHFPNGGPAPEDVHYTHEGHEDVRDTCDGAEDWDADQSHHGREGTEANFNMGDYDTV